VTDTADTGVATGATKSLREKLQQIADDGSCRHAVHLSRWTLKHDEPHDHRGAVVKPSKPTATERWYDEYNTVNPFRREP